MVKMINLDFMLIFNDKISPYFPEAFMRGGMGFGIKNLLCINPVCSACKDCMVNKTCLFPLMFTENSSDKIKVSPYSIHCRVHPDNASLVYFNMQLYGPLLNYYEHLVYAVFEIGKNGLGSERKKYSVLRITDCFTGIEIFGETSAQLKTPSIKEWQMTTSDTDDEKSLSVKFITPARIVRGGDLQITMPFSELIKSCVMRYMNLERAFHDRDSDIIVQDIISSAEKVITINENLRWSKKERFSTRQKMKISSGGFTGDIRYKGCVSKFSDILEFGKCAGIGKNTTFGCGRFKIF